jgi:hypothetical protein
LTVQAPSTNGATGWVRPTVTGACGDVELDAHPIWIQNTATLTYAGAGIECYVVEKLYNYTPAIPANLEVIQQVTINTPKLDAYIESGMVYVVNNSVAPGSSQSFTITLTLTDNLGCSISGTRNGVFYQKTLCDCGYDDPTCGGSDGPPMQMIVFPNPTSDELIIEDKKSEDFDIWLYNSSNELVLKGSSKGGTIEESIKGLELGIYYLTIQMKSGERYQQKVIKN